MLKLNIKALKLLAHASLMFGALHPTLGYCAIGNMHSNAPITIQSDKLEYHHQTGVVVHTGHVVVTQAKQSLKAHTLSIYRNKNSQTIDKMVAKGSAQQLAIFEGQLNETTPPISGHAQTISYFPQTHKLVLEGNALLTKERDTFSSPTIHFDLASSIATATKDEKTRPTVVIYKNNEKK